jgi:cell division protein FtsB
MTRKRKVYWLSLLLAISLAAVYWVHRDLSGRYERYRQSEDTVRSVQQEVSDLNTAISVAKGQVEKLETDPVEVEKAIRRIKKLVRPGETVYRIEPSPASGGKAAPSPPGGETGSHPNPGARIEGEQRSEKQP